VTTGRHDPCVGIRATPIAEAMLALVLMDHYLRFRAQCGDVVQTTPVITRRSRERDNERTQGLPRIAVVGVSSLIGEAVLDELRARKFRLRRTACAR
jgi:hypothetical protein